MATLLAAAASGDIWKHRRWISNVSNPVPYNTHTGRLDKRFVARNSTMAVLQHFKFLHGSFNTHTSFQFMGYSECLSFNRKNILFLCYT
jgi:hypothetical protein